MDKLIEEGIKFDAIITDPPYGRTAYKWDTVIPFNNMWAGLKKLRKENTPIILFGNEPFSSLLRISNLKEYKYDWKWDKNIGSNFVHAKYRPLEIYEDVIVFYKKRPTYNPQMELRDKDKLRVSGKTKVKYNRSNNVIILEGVRSKKYKYPVNKLNYGKTDAELNSKYRLHPAQKPLALIEYLIKTYTNEGDLILDFTCGSGTTLVAGKKLNRKVIGIEIEEKYCKITKNRILQII